MHGGLSVTPLMAFLCRRVSKALSRDPKIKLGSLVAPSERRTQSDGETLQLLLVNHLPNSVVTEVAALALSAAPNAWTGGWLRGPSLIEEWIGQLILLPHTKVQEWMGYSQPCCKKDGEFLSLTSSRSFVPA